MGTVFIIFGIFLVITFGVNRILSGSHPMEKE